MNSVKGLKMSHPQVYKVVRKLYYKARGLNTEPFTIRDGVDLIEKWSREIPNEYDCIVGQPRSGLRLAIDLAQKFGRPASYPEYLAAGRAWDTSKNPPVDTSKYRKVLVVDDSIYSGKQIREVLELLRPLNVDIDVATIFVPGYNRDLAKFYLEVSPTYARPTEWSLLTCYWARGIPSTDMDGVICHNGGDYATATPYLIHPQGFDSIITGRHERSRAITEKWLEMHHVRYNRLVMLPDSKPWTLADVVEHKARALKDYGANWYWESEDREARAIHARSGTPVLSVGMMRLYKGWLD